MSDDNLIAASDANYFESWRMLAESNGLLHEDGGILVTAPSASLAWMNVVFVTQQLRDAKAQLARAFALLDERKLPFFVHIREGVDIAAERACEQLGLVPENPVPGMALAPITSHANDASLEIRPVGDDASFSDFATTVTESFDIPSEETSALFPPSALTRPRTHFWVGYAEGQPVASSALIVIGDVAGINFIGTLGAFRGRGFGEQMTWAAVNGGAEAGCGVAVLQASEIGKPVYERMGFRDVTTYNTFIRGS